MTASAQVNPYVGLRPFDQQDSLRFFGRREQVAELLERLDGARFLSVVGSSGCGKSSLIRAGLLPALLGGFLVESRDRWRIATLKPGDSPLRNLALAISETDPSPADADALGQAIGREHTAGLLGHLAPLLGDDANLLILVDQFEEVFTFRGLESDEQLADASPAEQRQHARRRAEAVDFVDLLIALGRQTEVPVYVVLTMRTDFLGDCDLFHGLPEAMNEGRYLVPRLTRQQLREAVEGPALLVATRLAPRLVDHLLNALGDRADRLPVLQHALARTWEVWREAGGEGPIDLDHYRQAGTLEYALSRHAEEALPKELETTRRIFQRLTGTDGGRRRVRRRATVNELAAVCGLERSELEQALAVWLADPRHFLFLSQGAADEDPLVDLCHESLIRQWSRLKRWVDEEWLSGQRFGELVRLARRHAGGRTAKLRNPELHEFLTWRKATRPTEAWASRYRRKDDDLAVAMHFLDRSRQRLSTIWAVPLLLGGLVTALMMESSWVAMISVFTAFTLWALPRLGTIRAALAISVAGLFFLLPPGPEAWQGLALAWFGGVIAWVQSGIWKPINSRRWLWVPARLSLCLAVLAVWVWSDFALGLVLPLLFVAGVLVLVGVPTATVIYLVVGVVRRIRRRRQAAREAAADQKLLARGAAETGVRPLSENSGRYSALLEGGSFNPYVGLRPFEHADSLFFFGRRQQTAELLERLSRSRFLAVVGSSGCGKSSLIRAGLMPALLGGFLVESRDRWRVATMRPGDTPIRNLAASLIESGGSPADPAAIEEFRRAIAEGHTPAVIDAVEPDLGDSTNLLLLVDQFEEIFTFQGRQVEDLVAIDGTAERRGLAARHAEAAAFVDLLLGLAGAREARPIYVVLTMRTDFLGDCDVFYGLPEAMNRGRYLVPRLARAQLRQAIEGPARLAGTQLAPRLLDRLLNALGDRDDRLPVLQHALARSFDLWRRAGGEGMIDFEHYEKAGTLENALSTHAERSLHPEQLDAARRIFQRLTDTDSGQRRIRRPTSAGDLAAVSGLDLAALDRLLGRWHGSGRHFLRVSETPVGADTRVDIAHESLIRRWDRLRRWVDDERESRDRIGELVEGARRYLGGKASLLRNPALKQFVDWRHRARPTAAWATRYLADADFELAMSYLDRSHRRRIAYRTVFVAIYTWILVSVLLIVLDGKALDAIALDEGRKLRLSRILPLLAAFWYWSKFRLGARATVASLLGLAMLVAGLYLSPALILPLLLSVAVAVLVAIMPKCASWPERVVLGAVLALASVAHLLRLDFWAWSLFAVLIAGTFASTLRSHFGRQAVVAPAAGLAVHLALLTRLPESAEGLYLVPAALALATAAGVLAWAKLPRVWQRVTLTVCLTVAIGSWFFLLPAVALGGLDIESPWLLATSSALLAVLAYAGLSLWIEKPQNRAVFELRRKWLFGLFSSLRTSLGHVLRS